MSQRLIDAEHLRMSIYRKFKESGEPFFPKCRQEDVRLVDSEPTVDPYEHGEWKVYDEESNTYECSVCGFTLILSYGTPADNEYAFCPYCGARLIDEKIE